MSDSPPPVPPDSNVDYESKYIPPPTPIDPPGTYRCGTLTYTKFTLTALFVWLLWGDVCYTLMESVTGPIMLKKFEALNAPNWEVGLILTTIPTGIYSILNPIISFKSDRFRSRWGRRIPFILFSLPFLVLGLIGLAYGDRLGFWIYDSLHLMHASKNQTAMITLGALLVAFTFFNTFVTSTFWYLFNDVVPERFLARFMSYFRFLGTGCGAIYSFFIFPHSGTHSTEIFLGAAVLYLFGFGLMCFMVREGTYPPPPPNVAQGTGPLSGVISYASQTHFHSHYWFLWICTFIGSLGSGVAAFDLYFKEGIGLNMQQIGNIAGTTNLVVTFMILGSGWLADRYHPIRVVLVAQILTLCVVMPVSMIWLVWLPSPNVVYYVSLAIAICLAAPAAALGGMWDPPMLMRVFPRSIYGQFCSTNAVWRSLGGMAGGFMAGMFLDYITPIVGKEKAYFYSPLWSFAFAIPAFGFFLLFYRSWKKLGGDEGYIPPMLDSAGTMLPPMTQVEATVPESTMTGK